MRLKDRVAIVTGGGAGVGEAIALRYAKEGARVVVAEIEPARGEKVVNAIRQLGGDALFVQTDVASEQQIQALVETALARFGQIDVLVNNAAVLLAQKESRAHELTNEVWDRTMNVNLRGYWLCSKYVIPSMLRRGGSIIFIASRTGLRGFARLAAYSTSKGGVFALMRSMAVDYAADRIRVNAIVPGTMDTPMNAAQLSDPRAREKFIAKTPAGRLGIGEDIAGLATFLASDDAGFCIGGVYMADGGADVKS
jgi:NAD(P)-dependent dehydrogenase (short-subunit alcohol dehydrogenase family)